MKKFAFFGLALFFLMINNAMGYSQDLYYVKTQNLNDFNLSAKTNMLPENGSCLANIKYYSFINASSYYSYRFYVYINDNLNFTTDISGYGQHLRYLGNRTMTGNYFNTTLRALSLSSPVNTSLFIEMEINCTTNNGYFSILEPHYMDTRTYSTTNISLLWNDNIPQHLQIRNNNIKQPPNLVDLPATPIPQVIYYTQFNSGIGDISLNYYANTTTSSGDLLARGGIFLPEKNSNIELFFTNFTVLNNSYNITLEPFKNYVMYLMIYATTNKTIHVKEYNFTVKILDYYPRWVCGNWSECKDNFRTRTCVDANGLLDDREEQSFCMFENQTIFLGFEDFSEIEVKECNKYWFLTCNWFVENRTARKPQNPEWTIIPSESFPNTIKLYVATIENTEATEGTRALKMWYMPPYWASHPIYDTNVSDWVCTNLTFGYPAYLNKTINSTFFVSYNFTFPSPTMKLYFDVKKCPSQVVQYDTGIWCGKACYGNCTEEPNGYFWFSIYDMTEGKMLLRFDGNSTNFWKTHEVDVSNIINTEHQYELMFAVDPPNSWWLDPNGYCSYFDNVHLFNAQYSTKDEIALDLFGKLYSELTDEQKLIVDNKYCSEKQKCTGNDLYVYTLQNGVCISEIIENYSTCVQQQQQQQIQNQSIYKPIAILEPYTEQLKSSGFGFLNLFITPIFWIMLIIIATMTISAWITKHMEIGIASGVIMLILMASVFPELLWIAIVVIVISGFIIARTVVNAVRG